MRYVVLLIFHAITFNGITQPEPYHFDTYTTKNGLSSNSINCIIKDNRNFIWLGTEEGLNRFDGNRFITFFSDQKDTASLSSNIISDLLQYRPGQLLISTNNGLSVFNTSTNSFENNKISQQALRKGSGTYVRSLFKDRQGRIYVNHSGAIDVFNDSLHYLYRLSDLPWAQSLQGGIINKEPWFQDSQNRIWIPFDNKGICIIDEDHQQVYSWKNNPLGYPFMVRLPIRSFLYDEKKQVVWYAAWGMGLQKYDLVKKQNQIQLFGIPIANEARCINSITKDKNGMLICGGGQAIYMVNPETLDYKVINGDSKTNYLPAYIGSTILNDSMHIWIGTETKGLLKLPANEPNVLAVPLPHPIKDFTNFSTGIQRSQNGDIYLAYRYDGLLEATGNPMAVRQYKLNNEQGLPETVIRICEDKQNRLWVGTRSGLYIFNKQTKKFIRPPWLPSFTRQLYTNAIFCTGNGNLWMSFRNPNSLGFYNVAENKFTYYKNYMVNGHPVFDSLYRISNITEDGQGNIWMSSFEKGGILCYTPAAMQWKLYPGKSKNNGLLKDQAISKIVATANHNLWITNDGGLGMLQYNYADDSVSFITRKDGLLSDNVYAITKGPTNNLFLVSTAGINRYNLVTKEIRTLRLNDESINLSFSYLQFYDSIGRQLIYGLNDRILFVKDEVWQSKATTQTTFIDNITVNNERFPINPLTEKIRLGYSEKNISISFASASYTDNATMLYAYKMEGADNDWITTRSLPVANYTSLSPGTYTFMVKAKDETTEWGPVNNSLQITIAPPFWKTWWFITLLILLMVASVYLLFRSRVNSIRHQAGLKQKIATAEMQALRAQMNPHFIFNCLNAIDNMIQTNQKELATTYLSRFARLIRGVLDSSKNNLVPLYKDVETLKLYLQLEQFRCNNKFEYNFTVADELMHGDYKVPPLVVQPFLENAIHHGLLNKEHDDRKLSVDIRLQNDDIKYTISDNGAGRARAGFIKALNKPEHVSYGIQISKDRINMHNHDEQQQSVTITDLYKEEEPAGTIVEVIIKSGN